MQISIKCVWNEIGIIMPKDRICVVDLRDKEPAYQNNVDCQNEIARDMFVLEKKHAVLLGVLTLACNSKGRQPFVNVRVRVLSNHFIFISDFLFSIYTLNQSKIDAR